MSPGPGMQTQRPSNWLGGRLLAYLWLAAVAVVILLLYTSQKHVKESESVLQRLQSIEQRLAGHVVNATQSHSQQSSHLASLFERVDSRLSTADQQSNDHATKVKQHARNADSIHQRQEELQKNLEQQVKELGQHVQQEKQHLEQQEKLHKQSSVLQLNQQKEQQTKKDEKPPCATDRRVVVSLSTFSQRADYVPPTIYSLTNQKCRPNKIYLWVPMTVNRFNETVKEMPGHAKAMQDQFQGLVETRSTEDYGPSTKLLPTLKVETDPSTIIITVDDDVYYNPDTVPDLVKNIIAQPQHFHVRSCEQTIEENGKNITKWQLDKGICKGFITAYASAAYLRSMWDDGGAVFNFTVAPEGCRYHDDVWLSGNLYRRGFRPFVIQPHVHAWPVMYHRPYNKYSVNKIPDTIKFRDQCLHYFGWLLDRTLQYQKTS